MLNKDDHRSYATIGMVWGLIDTLLERTDIPAKARYWMVKTVSACREYLSSMAKLPDADAAAIGRRVSDFASDLEARGPLEVVMIWGFFMLSLEAVCRDERLDKIVRTMARGHRAIEDVYHYCGDDYDRDAVVMAERWEAVW